MLFTVSYHLAPKTSYLRIKFTDTMDQVVIKKSLTPCLQPLSYLMWIRLPEALNQWIKNRNFRCETSIISVKSSITIRYFIRRPFTEIKLRRNQLNRTESAGWLIRRTRSSITGNLTKRYSPLKTIVKNWMILLRHPLMPISIPQIWINRRF